MTDFSLPITYCKNNNLDKHITTDLELEDSKNLLKTIFKPKTPFGEKNLSHWSKKISTDKLFLKDTQKLLKSNIPNLDIQDSSKIDEVWKKITLCDQLDKDNIGFHEKYSYIDWDWLRSYNNSSEFLQLLSIYSMASPVISLALPIFFLVFPFLIIRLKGIKISIGNYICILKVLFKKHQIGQIFSISSASWNQRIYIIISLIFYTLQIYQNIRQCMIFCSNMKTIHSDLYIIRNHIELSTKCMNIFYDVSSKLPTYSKFNENMKEHLMCLNNFYNSLQVITPLDISVKKLNQIGHVRKCFYQINYNEKLKKALKYSFEFCGYIDNLNGIRHSIDYSLLGKCKFSKKQTKFRDAYFPITEKTPIKNTYNLDKHLIITGPNAAGKTTLLKTTLLNIILSQQIGYGCYKSASIVPFDNIHCYINIPDTSGRDSLFQAEARRCKDILSLVETNSNERHFCVFDELYSGTNPYEAISSAAAFLKYLNKSPNVCFVLTTHFLQLCKMLDKEKKIMNYHMEILGSHLDFTYTYKLVCGISNIKGGVKVLNDLEYPSEIVEDTQKIIDKLII